MGKDNQGLVGETVREAAEYINLKVDSIKLAVLESVSKLLSTIFSVFVFIILVHIGALFLAAALTWWLASTLNSFTYAALTVGGLFIVGGVIVFALRKKVLVNPVIRMLGGLIADITKKEEDDE